MNRNTAREGMNEDHVLLFALVMTLCRFPARAYTQFQRLLAGLLYK